MMTEEQKIIQARVAYWCSNRGLLRINTEDLSEPMRDEVPIKNVPFKMCRYKFSYLPAWPVDDCPDIDLDLEATKVDYVCWVDTGIYG